MRIIFTNNEMNETFLKKYRLFGDVCTPELRNERVYLGPLKIGQSKEYICKYNFY